MHVSVPATGKLDDGWDSQTAASHDCGSRNVRAPQSRVVGNTHSGQPAGQCHRKQTARPEGAGKGETVV